MFDLFKVFCFKLVVKAMVHTWNELWRFEMDSFGAVKIVRNRFRAPRFQNGSRVAAVSRLCTRNMVLGLLHVRSSCSQVHKPSQVCQCVEGACCEFVCAHVTMCAWARGLSGLFARWDPCACAGQAWHAQYAVLRCLAECARINARSARKCMSSHAQVHMGQLTGACRSCDMSCVRDWALCRVLGRRPRGSSN